MKLQAKLYKLNNIACTMVMTWPRFLCEDEEIREIQW